MKYIMVVLFAIFMTGCYAEKHDIKPNFTKENLKLNKSKSVYVSLPENGRYGNKIYFNSGSATTMAIKSALYNHIRTALEGREFEKFDDALSKAKEKGATYLMYPTILTWVDHATEWSGKADKISIKISVVNVVTTNEISSVIIKSNGTWWTLGGDHPQDLLEEPITEYIDSLY